MIDDRTSHLNLPLPHKDNLLEEDVERLRDAFDALDAKLKALDTLSMNKADKSELQAQVDALSVQHEEVQVLSAGQTIVDLTELDSTHGCTVFIEGARLNKNQWAPDPDIPTRLHLSKSYQAGYEIAVVRRQGGL